MKQYYQCQVPKVRMKQNVLALLQTAHLLPQRIARGVITIFTMQRYAVILPRKLLMLRLRPRRRVGKKWKWIGEVKGLKEMVQGSLM
jgi:hypothetical protein